MRVITSAQLDGYARRKDKSVSIRFVTGEKTSSDIAMIDQMIDTFGYLYFKAESTLTKEEVDELDNLDTELYDNPKTQAQRLRNVLYKLWQQEGEGDFKDFYKERTERIITHYKNQLQ